MSKKKIISILLSIMIITGIFLAFMLQPNAAIEKPDFPVLQVGSRGAEVQALQYLLRDHGYSLTADGIFGNGTKSVVESFQTANGLTKDGVVGKNTWGKLLITVKSGSKRNAVKALQTLLLVKYSYKTVVDGDFGGTSSYTYKAVWNYQNNKIGTEDPDGIVGPTTWQYLLGDTSKSYSYWRAAISKNWKYPLSIRHTADPSTGAKFFGANRTSTRQHAGVDLFGEPGTKVYAMTSGTVLNARYFDIGLEQVIIKNDDGSIARYTELIHTKNGTLDNGDKVSKGQYLGTIQKNTTSEKSCMLHLEVYSGVNGYDSYSLSQSGNKTYKYLTAPAPSYSFDRRSDIMNPMAAMYLK